MSHTPPPRLPAFAPVPVPVKRRADGWKPLRQVQFIGKLAETGSVSAAARFVGMARETAYRLRGKPGADEFARAWAVALAVAGRRSTGSGRCFETASEAPRQHERPEGRGGTLSPSKVTDGELVRRIVDGRWRPVLRRGKFVDCVHKHETSALLRHLARFGRLSGRGPRRF